MNKYKSLIAWQKAHEAAALTLITTDKAYHPRHFCVFDQIRRAGVSIEANVVEGYALGTTPLFQRHLRIAIGSAAEAESLVRLAGRVGYLDRADVEALVALYGDAMRAVRGLQKKLRLKK